MFTAFKKHIAAKQLFEPGQHLLLALSGGVDSVVLAHLLKAGGYTFSLAHCNFKLRGKESAADEIFCKQLAKQLDVPIYTKAFDTKNFAQSKGLSIQMAARQLRYAWFNELLEQKKMNQLVTAHHAGDVAETLFINLLRGTGIKGLKGIPEKTENLVRPLLSFGKEELLAYAKAHQLSYRTDKSNLDSKYERNFLRLKVLPLLRELQPRLEQVLLTNVANFKEEAGLVEEALAKKAKRLVKKEKGFIYLDKAQLLTESYSRSLLHYLLAPYNFNTSQAEAILQNIRTKGLAGKLFHSASHSLTIDRQQLVIKKNGPAKLEAVSIVSLAALGKVSGLKLGKMKQFLLPGAGELVVDSSRLIFPLSIRGVQRGDKFKPFGMKGFKLLSDFLKEQKLNNFEKESCRLLVNGNNEIVWVMGYRSDERYRVTAKSGHLIKLKQIG